MAAERAGISRKSALKYFKKAIEIGDLEG